MFQGERDAAPEAEAEAADVIPTDLHEEILSWLPSNHLLRFKLVSKEWNRLISSPQFIQKHLERSKADCHDSQSLVLVKTETTQILDRANAYITKKIPLCHDHRFLGSCDGLVLYYKRATDEIGALNPCTGKLEARVANPFIHRNDNLVCTWFGRHPATREYVLVVANLYHGKTNNRVVFKVYSLSRNLLLSSSTKELDSYGFQNMAPIFSFQKIGTLLHGRLHCEVALDYFPMLRNYISLVYDFETEIGIWASIESCGGIAGVVDGCLCAYRRGTKGYEVWVMKEYGVEDSWTKYADTEAGSGCRFFFLIPLAFCRNGDVILQDGFDELKKYSVRDRESKLLHNAKGLCTNCEVIECTDSLVSPALVWTKKE